MVDIADVQLCYGTSHFKSLATGGNVSKALVSNQTLVLKQPACVGALQVTGLLILLILYEIL